MGISEKNSLAPDEAALNGLKQRISAWTEDVKPIAQDLLKKAGGLAAQAVLRGAESAVEKKTEDALETVSEAVKKALSTRKDSQDAENDPETEEDAAEVSEEAALAEDATDAAEAAEELHPPEDQAEENDEEGAETIPENEPEDEDALPLTEEDAAAPEAAAAPPAPVSSGNETETAPAQPAPKREFPVFSVITAALLAVIALMSVFGVAAALLDMRLFKGLEDSAFVGLENFTRFLNNPNFAPALRNSAVLRLLQIGAGLILALPLMGWVRLGKDPGRTLTKAFLCLAPYCLPYVVSAYAVIQALPRDWIMDSSGGYLMYGLATVLQTAGFIGFCGGLFSYLKLRGVGNGARQGALLALLVSLLTVLTPDQGVIMMISNSMNRSVTTTLDSYAYSVAFMQNHLGLSSAVSVVKAVGQGAVGALAAALICKIAKKDETRIEIPDAKASLFTFTASRVIWTVILLALAALSFGIDVVARQPEASVQALTTAAQNVAQEYSMRNAAMVSAVVAALGGVMGGLTAYSFIAHFRPGRKGFGLAALIAASALTFLAAQFYAVSRVGLTNTVWPMILRQAVDPRLIGLMIVLAVALRMAPERRAKGLALGLALFGMAFAWGDFFGSVLYATGSSTTLAGRLYQMVMQGAGRYGAGAPEEALAQQATVPVMSLLISLPALTLGFFGAAFCIRSFKDAK